jgi:hypothetical protein
LQTQSEKGLHGEKVLRWKIEILQNTDKNITNFFPENFAGLKKGVTFATRSKGTESEIHEVIKSNHYRQKSLPESSLKYCKTNTTKHPDASLESRQETMMG